MEKNWPQLTEKVLWGQKNKQNSKPKFSIDSVYRKFDIPDKEQEQMKTVCQGHSEYLDLK